MSKFELYDKVELNKDIDDLLEGETGTIMSELLKDGSYAVAFNFDDIDGDILHTCDGRVSSNKGLYVAEEDLRKQWGR